MLRDALEVEELEHRGVVERDALALPDAGGHAGVRVAHAREQLGLVEQRHELLAEFARHVQHEVDAMPA